MPAPERPAPPDRGGRRAWPHRAAVPATAAVCALAGLLFATTALTARGIDLRAADERLPDLAAEQQSQVADLERRAERLRADVEAATVAQAAGDDEVAEVRADAARLAAPVGLTPVVGPGLVVTLDDAPRDPEDRPPLDGAEPPTADDLVVHEQDVQAVVNALWAGGAEAMALMGRRIIATTAVRCVGNTLLLQGDVFSPPFVVTAVGDPERLRAALAADPGVQVFQSYVDGYGLGLDVRADPALDLPAHEGPPRLAYADPLVPEHS